MAVMTASPSTPQRTPGSALWPSPQFSDYFSGADDTSSPNNHADQSKDTFVIQSQIVGRLNEIARKVAGQDGQQTPNLLDFQAELSTLEARLNAPDSQTREIAEDSENGLFSDDEDDAAQLQEENQELRRKVEEGKAVVARITKLTESLKHRYEEMKTINEIATQRIESTSDEIEALKRDNETLHEHNTHLYDDLSTAMPTISRLKSQVSALGLLALPHMDPTARDKLRTDIERWQSESEDVERDFEDVGRRYKKNGHGLSSSVELSNDNGMSSSSSEARSASLATGHRSRIILRRGGLIRRLDADSTTSEESDKLEESEEGEKSSNGYHVPSTIVVVEAVEDDDTIEEIEVTEDNECAIENWEDEKVEAVEEEMKATPSPKTPWQELWESLAEYAGIRDYDEDMK